MINEVINLREKADDKGFMPTLTTYVLNDCLEKENMRKRPAVLVCPGGGYAGCSPREAEPIALKFLNAGFHAFVLDYSVAPHVYPDALWEACESIKIIRKNAEKWNLDPDRIAVCGFSAGGHLTASVGTLWNKDEAVKCEDKSNQPNAIILSYPVITSGKNAHRGSFENLLGENKNDEKMLEYLSLEKQVSKDTPPTFLWHTFSDGCVPVENSLCFASALRDNNIPFEMHIYPEGQHGLATVTKETCSKNAINTHTESWMKLACEWLDFVFETDKNMTYVD